MQHGRNAMNEIELILKSKKVCHRWKIFLSKCVCIFIISFFFHFRLHEGANCLKFLQYPQNSIEIIQDSELNLNPKNGEEFVQISPQRIKLKLRPGIDFEFSFEVAQSKDYPVDLYYLMDLSNSMSDDKDTIVRMGKNDF